ncbi:MAG TPA: hypothetical protein VKV15_25915 [Bryobacteraceae bacterium]|jgi:hypothetical protein|nr:hypothetical protein [Bryobacteraceae bacterium]
MNLPLEFLLTCSERTAGDFQLARLDEFARLKRQARELQEQAIEKAIEAGVALYLRTHRDEIMAAVKTIAGRESVLCTPGFGRNEQITTA